MTAWASYQIRKIAGAHAPGMPRNYAILYDFIFTNISFYIHQGLFTGTKQMQIDTSASEITTMMNTKRPKRSHNNKSQQNSNRVHISSYAIYIIG